MKVCGAIAGDGGEPAWKFGGFAKGVEPGERLEENVLNEIVDVGVRNSGEEDAVHHAGIASVEESEGGAVALLGGADEGVVFGAAIGFVGRNHGRETGVGGMKFKECRHVASMEIEKRLAG